MVKLRDLYSSLRQKEVIGDPEVEVKGLAYHSQRVEPGFLFAALNGLREDGKRFIPDALKRGAASILVDQPVPGLDIAQLVVSDVREALARLSAAFCGNPSLSLTLIGITGTNGKTTTSYLVESILKEAGHSVGVMGTVNYRYPGTIQPAPNTTPESLDLQKNLRAMREAGVTHGVLEVSSHALDMQRIRGCHFDAALFTNLTRDHLDYHGSMDHYFQAKKRLFTEYLSESQKDPRFAITNLDDPKGEELSQIACGTIFRYGIDKQGEVWPEKMEGSPEGLRLKVRTPRGSLDLTSSMIGRHNVYNLLATVSIGEALNIPQSAIVAGIQKLSRVPGRLERVPGDAGIRVFVDYAHTDDALKRALESLQPIRSGRLIVVFGCGGDRDRGKRPLMGRIAALGSDLAVVTSDNPRTEDPMRIIEEIEEGIHGTGRRKYQTIDLLGDWKGSGYLVVPDRREAIHQAIRAANREDIVLIAGKGHEDYQIMGQKKFPFDDREVAAEALTLRSQGKATDKNGEARTLDNDRKNECSSS
jgi:UDP-N-acetylmuramoyl-L-alanyl-D-glutamate--2,6-diaminopimelate ligase